MDNFEKLISEDQSRKNLGGDLDIDAVISGTHKRIKRRQNRRRALYTSPAVLVILAISFLFTRPGDSNGLLPGDELILVGMEYSSSILMDESLEEANETAMLEASIDYITDGETISYDDHLEEILTEEDIEAFYSYLKEV